MTDHDIDGGPDAEQTVTEIVTDAGSYADDAPLTYLLGDSARARILGAVVSEKGREMTVSDIARLAGVARSTVYAHLDTLERLGVLTVVRYGRDGHSRLYQLNDDCDVAMKLYELEGVTLQRLMDSEFFE